MITENRGYDLTGALTSVTVSSPTQTYYSSSITRDALERISQKIETISGVTTTWGYLYDVTGRLTQVSQKGNSSVQNGNKKIA